jgi:carbamoyltransferase
MIILGVNSAYHESSSAIVVDGRIIAAAEDERFSGRKHGKPVRVDNAHDLPLAAINYCLREVDVTWSDLDAVAFSLDPSLRRRFTRLGIEGDPNTFGHPIGEACFQASLALVRRVVRDRTHAPVHFVSHHLAHAWYAVGTSTFELAAVLVMDGIGERASSSAGLATRSEITFTEEQLFPASIGLAWEKVARFLGLTEYDACKVMALAAFSDTDEEYFANVLCLRDGIPYVDEEVFRLERPKDFGGLSAATGVANATATFEEKARVAAAIQRATEHVVVGVTERLRRQHKVNRLVLGGGVALNCRANAVLASSNVMAEIHAGPASHDAGTAIGAAWQLYAKSGKAVPYQDPRLIVGAGPDVITDGPLLERRGWIRAQTEGQEGMAVALRGGEPIGWIDGRCEFGPRALGRRSILASPANHYIVAQINRLKQRHSFEPLAVSIAEELAGEVFDLPFAASSLTRYMLTTATPTLRWRSELGHLVHRDGTLRVHVVRQAESQTFHRLLMHWAACSSLPFLVNTSLNRRGDPMPADLDRSLKTAEVLGLRCLAVEGQLWTLARPRNILHCMNRHDLPAVASGVA